MGKYNITSGKIHSAQKVLVYGPEGVGKSTFASRFPDPLFIDTEGSTRKLDVKRLPNPTSWPMLLDEVMTVKNERMCKTLVIDTIDWAERLCMRDLCASQGLNGIEDFGYGKGYVYLAERFGILLNLLEEVIQAGINVVLNAHAKINKFEQPDEMGAYDRWELKLEKKTAPLVKEWADMILFANYKTIVVTDSNTKKKKGQGGQQRVMYTTHSASWDAKNRDGLPMMLNFDFNEIANLFIEPIQKIESVPNQMEEISKDPLGFENNTQRKPMDIRDGLDQEPPRIVDPEDIQKDSIQSVYDGLPKALVDLMKSNNVTEENIRDVVAQKGYFPKDMPVKDYPADFIEGVLIGAWNEVYQSIVNMIYPF